MNTKNKLNCYLYSNLICCFLSFYFYHNNQDINLIKMKNLDNATLNPIYEIKKEETVIQPSVTTLSATNNIANTNTTTISYVKPSYNKVTGEYLVNYAKNYLGLRYVSGGNSLTTGTDCSGFTKLIYKEFGINLGRTVSSQIYSGTYVSKADLKPGDLVFYGQTNYASHVGIYMGNGLVIHQSNPRDGVKINSVNMMVYITARRVITSDVTIEIQENTLNKEVVENEPNKDSAKDETVKENVTDDSNKIENIDKDNENKDLDTDTKIELEQEDTSKKEEPSDKQNTDLDNSEKNEDKDDYNQETTIPDSIVEDKKEAEEETKTEILEKDETNIKTENSETNLESNLNNNETLEKEETKEDVSNDILLENSQETTEILETTEVNETEKSE